MKKIIILFVSIISMFSFGGCGTLTTQKGDNDLPLESTDILIETPAGHGDNEDDASKEENLSNRVFTLDDFSFIVPWETTMEEVYTTNGFCSDTHIEYERGTIELYPTEDPYTCVCLIYIPTEGVIGVVADIYLDHFNTKEGSTIRLIPYPIENTSKSGID